MILDYEKLKIYRDALKTLGYSAKTKYFQFIKELRPGVDVIIDMLSPPYPNQNFKEIRVRPANIKDFHLRRNNEAFGIHIGLIPINRLHNELHIKNLFIVSSFNYVILKLHAFKDNSQVIENDFGRYHAYDIFATLIDMDVNDWVNARSHLKEEQNKDYIHSAISIVNEYFGDESSFGIIRLKEYELYKRNREEFDSYISFFKNDLKELFEV